MQTYSLTRISGLVPIIEHEALIARSVAEVAEAVALLSCHCTVTIYATQGEALWVSERESVSLTKGDLLIHHLANEQCELIPEKDFGMFAVCVSSEFNRQFSQSIKISWKVRQALITNALFHLSAEDGHHVNENYKFLLMKAESSDHPQKVIVMRHLLYLLSIEILLRLERYLLEEHRSTEELPSASKAEVVLGNTTSAQVIYNRFTGMLEKTSAKLRPVGWWASQLNISAKYLGAICREIEGRSARELIADSIIQEAIHLMQNTQLTVKEISERLGFQNQSHFGTFFKRHTGHSPIRCHSSDAP